jgi:CDP-2,3-bis-(O-geranylgeranyl)-sn-glycerol synthase
VETILFTIWFFGPAGLANMAPVIANNIPAFQKYTYPLDFKKTYRGKRIFGNNKTFRGLIAGICMGAFAGMLQVVLYKNIPWIGTFTENIDYGSMYSIIFGAALGFGALLGDAVESFFKRQLDIEPGKSWPIFDQIDLIVGASLISLLFVTQPWYIYVTAFCLILLLHPITNVISWLLGLQKEPL